MSLSSSIPARAIRSLATTSTSTAGPSKAMYNRVASREMRQLHSMRSLSTRNGGLSAHRILSPSIQSTRAYSPATQVPSTSATSHSSQRLDSASASAASLNSSPKAHSGAPESDPETDDPEPESGPEPKSAYARFKLLSKKYGGYAVGMYTFLSFFDFSFALGIVHAVGAERIQPVVSPIMYQFRKLRHGEAEAKRLDEESKEKAKLDALEAEREMKSGKGKPRWIGSKTFWTEVALAYAIHKTLFLPFRAGLTVAWTPKVVKWMASKGWVGKGGFGRAATHAQGKIRTAQDRVKAKVGRDAA